ncbi:MAG: hypothetical protein FWE09_00380 [Treponema sp.]|nr:hypothetical protein [Treponema sp.]
MPELIKWVSCDGKTYCWDKTARKVVEVKITAVPLEDVPKIVLATMFGTEEEEEGK